MNNLGFFSRLTISFTLFLAITFFVTFLFISKKQESEYIQLLIQNAKTLTKSIALASKDKILTNSFDTLQTILDESVDEEVKYAYILDREGNCLAHTDRSRIGTRFRVNFLAEWKEKFSSSKDSKDFVMPTRDRGDVVEVVYPVRIDAIRRFYGVVNVSLKRDILEKALSETREMFLWIFLFVLVSGFFVTSILAILATEPIQDITALARNIAHGNYDIPEKNHQFFEEKVLRQSLRTMAGTIQGQVEQLQESNRKLDRRIYELNILMEASLKMNSKCYSNEVLEHILDQAVSGLNAEWGSLLLADQEEKSLVPRVVRGKYDQPRGTVRIGLGEGIAGKVFKDHQPYISNLGAKDPLFEEKDPDRESMIQGIVCAPVVVEGEAIGVINVINKKEGDFDSSDGNLLVSLAALIARSIENSQLYNLAITDGLTGLFIKRYFQDRLDDFISQAQRYKLKFSLIYADIDHFKKVNDTYGHVQGDMVIKCTAKTLLLEARDNIDLVARIGGEEFAVILPETDQEGAAAFAQRVRKRVEHKLAQESGLPGRVTMSFGVATFPRNGKTSKELVLAADQALYKSKEGGRNQVNVAG